jgi:hypothetical protein
MTSYNPDTTSDLAAAVTTLLPEANSPQGKRMRLSAAMDGTVSMAELEQVLEDIEQDPELAELWSRYHRLGEELRAAQESEEIPVLVGAERIADRVAQAISQGAASESVVVSAARPLGWSLAASIALATVVSVLAWQTFDWMPSAKIPVASLESAPTNSGLGMASAEGLPLPPQSERIQRYLEQHHAGQTAGAGAIPGILPWVRVVGFDATRP